MNTKWAWVCVGVLSMCLVGCGGGKRGHVNYGSDHGRYDRHGYGHDRGRGPNVVYVQNQPGWSAPPPKTTVVYRGPGPVKMSPGPGYGSPGPGSGPGYGKPGSAGTRSHSGKHGPGSAHGHHK